jgi:hypothetical protein
MCVRVSPADRDVPSPPPSSEHPAKTRRVDKLHISLTRAYVAATGTPPFAYADAVALPGTDHRVKSASKTIALWREQGPAEVHVGRGGVVGTLNDLVGFFFHAPARVKKVGCFFRPPLWGQALFDAVGHAGPDPLSKEYSAQVTATVVKALPAPWKEVLERVLNSVSFGVGDRQTMSELWEELAGVAPRGEFMSPCEIHDWDYQPCRCDKPYDPNRPRPPCIRHRFSRSLGRCLADPALTEQRLRGVIDATNELLPERLDVIVKRAQACGNPPTEWELRHVVAEIEKETCDPLGDELRRHVEEELKKVLARFTGDEIRRRLDRVAKAAKLSACYGYDWGQARYEASEMDGNHVFQGGMLFETQDYVQEDEHGWPVRDAHGEFTVIPRFCRMDVHAWRHFLELGGWDTGAGDDVHKLFCLFRNYHQKNLVEMPHPGILRVQVLHPWPRWCLFEDAVVDHAEIAKADAPSKVWWCRVWFGRTGLAPHRATYYPLYGDLIRQHFQ